MSLGWLNLQDYLGANREAADDMAGKLDEQQAGVDVKAAEAAQRGESVSYSQFLTQRRRMAQQRQTDEGRAAMLGGDIGDAFLAGQGTSRYSARPMATVGDVESQRRSNQQRESDYWAQQQKRNTGLAQQAADARKKQQEGFDASRRALGQLPGYGRYSNAVRNSFDKSRNRQVRVISQEESDEWTR